MNTVEPRITSLIRFFIYSEEEEDVPIKFIVTINSGKHCEIRQYSKELPN